MTSLSDAPSASAEVEILAANDLPPAWLSPPSGANYAVGVGESARRIGVVHVGQAVGDGRALGG
ncbi:hypothetical protein [Profundibacter amoris]|uniref:Uncharacterized protein n=1 Tax=Profundibacter amoris TaxID=2171755 RepID=A0A347UK98_9RHOB|nr:hypothetical protein [Profundibacter amoris]AXX99276.1 hypothetical protein BAR1_15850 [Profundibacter amoris]